MKKLLAIACCALVYAQCAPAQTGDPPPDASTPGGNPAGTPALTPRDKSGAPAPHQFNVADRLFVRELAIGGTAEVALGQLASERGGTEAKAFGQRMIDDHNATNRELAGLGHSGALDMPERLDMDHAVVRDQLGKLRGADFDRLYLASQIVDHQRTVTLLEWEIDSGQDRGLRQFAMNTLPTVMRHLEMANDLHMQLVHNLPKHDAGPGTGR